MGIEVSELDRLRQDYKSAVDRWVDAIRQEEALATPDHSVAAWDRWEKAGFKIHAAYEDAIVARKRYQDGLRLLDYGF